MAKYLLGFDLGSSSVKVSLVDSSTGQTVASAQSPKEEMPMLAVRAGWAEQDPEMWWEHAVKSTHECLRKSDVKGDAIAAIGISYQMHGLVCVDKDQRVLRPSIIWCDSRAVAIGDDAAAALGQKYCLEHYLNSPGNFTASKLAWVKQNEPEIFERIHKVMLPGAYIAMRLSGQINTTDTGLSEGIFWDYQKEDVAVNLLDHYGIDKSLIADQVPVEPCRVCQEEERHKRILPRQDSEIARRCHVRRQTTAPPVQRHGPHRPWPPAPHASRPALSPDPH